MEQSGDGPSCFRCGRRDVPVARALGCCVDCIRDDPDQALPFVRQTCQEALRAFSKKGASQHKSLSPRPDTDGPGMVAMGFYDDHPSNCIASWQCPGTTGCGYPQFAVCPGTERGWRNLAVFSAGCNFNCPFCQDWIHRTMLKTGKPWFSDQEIVGWIDDRTSCVCFCGGTPDLHMDSIIRIAQKMREKYPPRILRFCAETNLTAPWRQLECFGEIVFESGGGFNIGLKAGSDSLHRALTGRSNEKVWRNLERLYKRFGPGDKVPFLRPSLLVIPGYTDEKEVQIVGERLKNLDPSFSLKLIAFLPRYLMNDLPAAKPELLTLLAQIAGRCGLGNISPLPDEPEAPGRFIRRVESGACPNEIDGKPLVG